jgi:hypothetical protein
MSAPVPDELGLGHFDDYAAKLGRATLRPSVDVGPRISRELVVELVRALGYDPQLVASITFEPDVVLVVEATQLPGEFVKLRTIEHRVEP